jgi:rSAM/selenodomain-associated transferase 2
VSAAHGRTALSVVMPVLNEAAGIRPALDALRPLRARGTEVIVVDGGSTDGTAAVCAGRVEAVIAAPRGRAAQMNAGATAARGAVLLFLHADTLLPADADERVLEGLAASGRCWGRFDVAIDGRSRWLAVVAWMMNRRSRWSGIATGDQAIFITREAFDAVGGFPLQPLMEDIELSARLRQRGRPLCLRDRVHTSGRRWEQRGVWRTIMLMWRLRLLYRLGVSPERLARAYR